MKLLGFDGNLSPTRKITVAELATALDDLASPVEVLGFVGSLSPAKKITVPELTAALGEEGSGMELLGFTGNLSPARKISVPELAEALAAISPDNPNVIPFDSADVHPLAIAGTDFQFADRAAFIADITTQFPDDSIPGDYTYNTTPGTLETVAGRKVWRMLEHAGPAPTFYVAKLISGPQRLFCRSKMYIPPSPPGWVDGSDKFSPEVTLGGQISNGGDYSFYTTAQNQGAGSAQNQGAGVGEGGFQTLSGLGGIIPGAIPPPFWTPRMQGKTTDWLLLLETGPTPATDPVHVRFWMDGGAALIDLSEEISAAADAWNLISLLPHLNQAGLAPDAVNNYVDYKLIEFVPWPDGEDCPYSGITV